MDEQDQLTFYVLRRKQRAAALAAGVPCWKIRYPGVPKKVPRKGKRHPYRHFWKRRK